MKGIGQIIKQLTGIAAFGVFCAGTSFIIFSAIKATMGLRVSKEEEIEGLDLGEHGMVAYNDFVPRETR
jgi:Amt family ammonium transporter